MKKTLFYIFLSLSLFSASAQNYQYQKKKAPKIMVLKGVNLVDVESKTLVEHTNVIIEGSKIREVSAEMLPDSVDQVIELKGKYLIPGLIDAHTHLTYGLHRDTLVKQMAYYVNGGVTSVRDVGGDTRQLAEIKMAINKGDIIGPDISYSAFLATDFYYRGEGADRSWMQGMPKGEKFAPWVQLVEPGDDLDAVMIAAKATGATGVKIYLGYDKAYLEKIVAAAKKQGLQLWSHAMLFPAKPSDVVDAGVKVLSHAYMLEWEATDKTFKNASEALAYNDSLRFSAECLQPFIKKALEKDVIIDATLFISQESIPNDPSVEIVKELYKYGVKVSAGTDWFVEMNKPLPPLYAEIDYLVELCGFTPMDALRSATIIAAETFKGQDRKGSIAVGKDADMIVLDKNPLEDIKNLRSLEMVIKGGKVLDRPAM